MIERILPDMYRVEIPLPRNPLKALNSYVIKSPDRCYVIDTGMNRKECRQAMDEAVQELDIDLSRTDFFITHLHADHEGQARELATPTSVIYMSEDEAAIIINNRNDKRWQMLEEFFISHGAPEDEARAALQNHPGRIYSSYKPVKYHYVANNDVLQFGSYNFTCIETPGHTPHHMCLYDADKKILIAGDHILIDITPNITHWPEMDNALKKYLDSLDSIDKLEVNLLLPGHRSIVNNHRARIRELHAHHEARLKEVIAALTQGPKTAYETAPHIKWDLVAKSWAHFPPAQKWFAIGETVAHLEYLEAEGAISRTLQNGKVVFSIAG